MQTDKKKKILVLASTFPRWKNDTTPPFVFELEKRLTNNFEIYILAPHSKGAKKFEVWDNQKIYRFQYFWPESLQKLCYEGGIIPNLKKNRLLIIQAITLPIFATLAAINILRKEKVDLLHAHWIIPQGIITLLLNKLFKIPYLVTTHGGDIYGLQNPIFNKLKKMVLRNASKVIVVSNDIKRKAINTIDKNLEIEVIPMGVDSKLFNPNKRDLRIKDKYEIKGPFLLFVGRLVEKKGPEYLIRAMEKVLKKFPKAKLLIIGEGTLEERLVKLTDSLNLQKNIHFTGPISNYELPSYYATADIFIGPSIRTKDGDTEGLGLTFVEASFSGCIPIGTNVGGISDVIKNQESGFIVEEKNPKALAASITKILNNKSLEKSLRDRTRSLTLSHFDWSVIKNKYSEIYKVI
jgi:glycosyltransferase involved in cell wall biosynthesis